MTANLSVILYFLLILLLVVSSSVLLSMWLDVREGFANALDDYKSTSGYKTAAAAVVALADSRGNGRRDITDMLASSVAPPAVEQCLVNFFSLGCRFSGYLGPFSNGYFDTDVAVTSALKMGCRTFVLEIDYMDSCNDYFPRLVVRDVNGRIRSNEDSSLPTCNTLAQSNITAVCKTLRVAAFGPAVQNPNDPLIVVLYLLRLPPRDKTGQGSTTLLTYLSNVAKCLAPLLDKTIDNIGTGGTFARQQQESTLLTNNIIVYQGRVLFFCNADTSPFRTTTAKYSQNEDLDYIVNLRLSYKQSQLGCTSNKTGGTPYSLLETAESYMTLPPDQIESMRDETKLRWTICFAADPSQPVPQKTYDEITGDIGIHCVPIQIWDTTTTAFMFDDEHFKVWSFIPKPSELRFRRPPVAVPQEQVPQANSHGGLLRTPTT
jgi:hypothetical protein